MNEVLGLKQVVFEGKTHMKNIDLAWPRRKIGMVFQKPNPFPKSITITSLWAEYSIKDKKS